MPVIVLTTIEPPPPPPTGFGGNFVLPVEMFDLMRAGSLRVPDDNGLGPEMAIMITMYNNSISGSLRAPDDDISLVGILDMNTIGVADSLTNQPSGPIDNPVIASVISGSPDVGVI